MVPLRFRDLSHIISKGDEQEERESEAENRYIIGEEGRIEREGTLYEVMRIVQNTGLGPFRAIHNLALHIA